MLLVELLVKEAKRQVLEQNLNNETQEIYLKDIQSVESSL